MWWKWVLSALSTALGAVMFMAGVNPDDARANIKEWIESYVPSGDLASWLFVILGIVFVASGVLWARHLWDQRGGPGATGYGPEPPREKTAIRTSGKNTRIVDAELVGAGIVAEESAEGMTVERPRIDVTTPRAISNDRPFDFSAIRATIAKVNLAGLVAAAPADEALEIVMNVDNYSGLPVRITSVSGFIMIFGERKRPDPTIANLPIDLALLGPCPAVLTQQTQGLREVIFVKGLSYGGIMPFNLGNLELHCEATMPDGTTREGVCGLAEKHFLVRGPLKDDEDLAALNRTSITYGSNRHYGADGRKEKD